MDQDASETLKLLENKEHQTHQLEAEILSLENETNELKAEIKSKITSMDELSKQHHKTCSELVSKEKLVERTIW